MMAEKSPALCRRSRQTWLERGENIDAGFLAIHFQHLTSSPTVDYLYFNISFIRDFGS
jgi:hypothetical protein